jgi:molybdopterin molybdotransferase
MIEFDKAYKIVLGAVEVLGKENIKLNTSPGRILAEDIVSDMPMPPFDKAAVDGYACRKEDIGSAMELIEVIPAGVGPRHTVTPGKCSKVMTGGVVPKGADTVIMVEDSEQVDENQVRFIKEKTNTNICYLGEDVRQGQIVLEKGALIRPQEIAILASVGCVDVPVFKQPLVGIISTGDELVEPHIKPKTSQIRNSNASQLTAQIGQAGAHPKYFGIAGDTEVSTREKITKALAESDVVLLTGGVSMGDFDYVPKVLNDLGIEIQFKSIAVQPGRPTVFATKEQKYLFGLPGNPVSSFVQFELLVKPMLFALMGHHFKSPVLKLPMGETFARRKTKRKSFIPVNLRSGKVYPVEYHGSAHIHSYIFADGMVAVERGKSRLEKGELVDVRSI